MKFKIEENLPAEAAALLCAAGHDAVTVVDQALGGRVDPDIHAVCCRERRVLVTLDPGFGDVRVYPPRSSHGIIVLRLSRQDKPGVLAVMSRLLQALSEEALQGKLWIVDERRIRIRG